MYIFDLKFKGKKWVQNSDIQKLTTRINLKHLKKNVTQPYPQLKIKTPFLQKINSLKYESKDIVEKVLFENGCWRI